MITGADDHGADDDGAATERTKQSVTSGDRPPELAAGHADGSAAANQPPAHTTDPTGATTPGV